VCLDAAVLNRGTAIFGPRTTIEGRD
jgi:hypothetical protein